MCVVKTPKIKPSDPASKTPDPTIIRNLYLDDANAFALNRKGRSQLRIDPGSSRQTTPPPARTPAPLPSSSSGSSGGYRGGGLSSLLGIGR